jgi:superfamily I DNA and RNA helicase
MSTWWVKEGELIAEQKTVIALPLAKSHLVVGPPGSGKTNLLLLRANYMTLAGEPDICIIVFTKTLQEFIAQGSKQYKFAVDRIKTCAKWQREFLYSYGVKIDVPDDFNKQRDYLYEQMVTLVEGKKLKKVYDAILLDEAQDYRPHEIELFARLAKKLFVVADQRQKIYRGKDSLETIQALIKSQHTLQHHFRNGERICKLADLIGRDTEDYEPMLPTSNYDNKARPSTVDYARCATLKSQAERIISRLDTQLKAYPDELIGILCPRNEEVDAVWEEIKASPFAAQAMLQKSGEHGSFSPDKTIVVGTIHSAKGLEFRSLHIAAAESLKKFQYQRNIAYTAVTRAKTSLSIYYTDSIPGFLEKALRSMEPLPDLPKIADTFGGAA